MTPAEVRAMCDRVVEEDKARWSHTSAIMWASLTPHQRKGSNIKPEQFNPYIKKKGAITREQFVDYMNRPEVQKNQERIKEQWKGKKTVFDKIRDKKKK